MSPNDSLGVEDEQLSSACSASFQREYLFWNLIVWFDFEHLKARLGVIEPIVDAFVHISHKDVKFWLFWSTVLPEVVSADSVENDWGSF